MGYSSSRSVWKQSGTQGAPICHPGSLRQETMQGRCLEGEVAKGHQVCLPTSKHNSASPGHASKMTRGPDHGHTPLARSELVLRDHTSNDRATKSFSAISVAPMDPNNQGNNSKGHEKHRIDCLKAHITICAWNGIRDEISRKVMDSWTKGTKHNYQHMFE